MIRARSANRVGIVVLALLVVFSAPSAGIIRGSTSVVSPASFQEMLRLRSIARDTSGPESRSRWFEVALFSLRGTAADVVTPEQMREMEKTLREATSHLPATDLAALGAAGAHPILSESYVRALRKSAPKGVSAQAEMAAEARDAVATFEVGTPPSMLDFLKPGRDAAAPSAGGVQRSVYSILVLGDGAFDRDSTVSSFSFLSGIRFGVEQGSGALTSRFRVVPAICSSGDLSGPCAARVMQENRAGVMLVAASELWDAASATATMGRIVVLDAREPEQVESMQFFEREERAPGIGQVVGPVPAGLRETRSWEPDPPPEYRPFLLRPTPEEQARRLTAALATRPDVRRIAVAIPTRGGDERLAMAFGLLARASGRETQELVYEPGRRDFSPEAAQFISTGAQAILFAGSGEETGEWLAALATKKSNPLLLGTKELDPEGFHARVRPRLENAIVVGDDWNDRNPDLLARMNSKGEESSHPAFRRGFRIGWTVARAVLEGSFTPSSLRIALEAAALKGDERFEREMGMFKGPSDVVLPLYVVRSGRLVAQP